MKKTLSLVLVAVMIMSIAITSFADTSNTISLGTDSDTGISLQNSLLTPNEEYRFPVNISLEGEGSVALTDELLKDYSIRVSNSGKGKSLESLELIKLSGVYNLVADVKAGYPASQTEEEHTLKLVKKSDGKTYGELKVEFMTGYKIVDDAVVDALDAEDYIPVDNDAPVFTEEQLERIGRVNSYKKVTFEGSNWTYNVNVTDMKDLNMLHNTKAIAEVLAKYASNSFEFLSFPAEAKFTTNGDILYDVADISESYGQNFYVYRYNNGKLSPVAASYNYEDDMLTIQTNTLGNFVITDKKLTDLVVTTPSVDGGSDNNDSNVTNPTINPNTGVNA